MHSNKKSVQIIASLLEQNHIKDFVFSPGSRNAPFVIEIENNPFFKTSSFPDERCAAFFALGISQHTNHPAVVCCTSGSAALNYAPAIAEAYYQQVPMIIITADRPREWIDHGEGQSIRQNNIYHNYIKGSYDLPQDIHNEQSEWQCNRLVNEAINLATTGPKGPIHINVPFSEPLYNTVKEMTVNTRTIKESITTQACNLTDDMRKAWNDTSKKLILCGQNGIVNRLQNTLENLSGHPDVAIISEHLSNLQSKNFNPFIDRSLAGIPESDLQDYLPELIITIGNAIVSKRIKALFREHPPKYHWHISESGHAQDMFKALTHKIKADVPKFLSSLNALSTDQNSDFNAKWLGLKHTTAIKHETFINNAPFCDLTAYQLCLDFIQDGTTIHMANSTAVRYINLFNPLLNASYYCNRGTSGIDGCTSTALGHTYSKEKPTVLFTGDIAFFYDSNAFWNDLSIDNLKIVVFNNAGGNIFRIIDGPGSTDHIKKRFETRHQLRADKIAAMYNIDYFCAENMEDLEAIANDFFAPGNTKLQILEIITDPEVSPKILQDYFKNLRP